MLVQGGALGFRKGAKAGTWIARWRDPGGKQHYQAWVRPTTSSMPTGWPPFPSRRPRRGPGCGSCRWPRVLSRRTLALYTVHDALDVYLNWLARHRRSAKDATWKADALIRPVLGRIPLPQLTPTAIRKWHEELAEQPARVRSRRGTDGNGYSLPQQFRAAPQTEDERRARRASANRVLTILRAALNRAYQDGKAPSDDAWRRVKPFPKADAARVRYLSRGECTRLLNACEPSFRKLVRAALLTGC